MSKRANETLIPFQKNKQYKYSKSASDSIKLSFG